MSLLNSPTLGRGGSNAPVARGYSGTGDFNVANRSSVLIAVSASGSGQFTRLLYTALTDIAELRLVYANWYTPSETSPANAIDVKAYVEPLAGWWRYVSASTDWNSGTAYAVGDQVTRSGVNYVAVTASSNSAPATFKADPWRASTPQPIDFPGQSTTRTVTIPPGSQIVSAPITVQITAGQRFAINTLVIPTGGTGVIPTGLSALPGSTAAAPDWVKAGATDYAATPPTTTTSDSGVACYHPIAVLGRPATGKPRTCVAMIGDSITYGVGDTASPAVLPDPGGWQARLFSAYPNHRIARASDQVSGWVDGRQRAHHRYGLAAGCSHAVTSLGNNDVAASSTVASIQSQLIDHWRHVAASVPVVHATTITPRTTSTDSWATVGNQTATTNFGAASNWSNLNAWLLDGAPLDSVTFAAAAVGATSGTTVRAGAAGHPLRSVIDIHTAVTDATTTWAWKPGYTTDGTHPSSTGHAAIAAALNAATLLG